MTPQDNTKNNLQFALVQPQVPSLAILPVETTNNRGMVLFGDNNDYPNELYKADTRCTILSSIINAVSDYVCGENLDMPDIVNKKGMTKSELIRTLVRDYIVNGAFAVQVLRNGVNDIAEWYAIPPRYVRLNEEGDTVYYSKKFAEGGMPRKYLTYERYNGNPQQKDSIYYYRRQGSANDTYGVPMWATALQDVMTNIAISDYHYNSIKNDFSPSAIINFNNGVPSDDQQKKIERQINEKFSGENNASKLLLSWNNDKEHALTIERLQSDDFGTRYESLANSVRDNILAAFRVSPQLVGINDYATSFNSVEFEQSFKLFKKTVISPIQTELEGAFVKIGLNIDFQEYTITFEQ